MSVADVGAGTGLFTRAFAKAVGTKGSVTAVDISKTFLDHIAKTSREEGMTQVVTLEASTESSNLPADSVDLVFICDTYHHFEFPIKTMQSVHRALRSGGRVVMIDFKRIEGESTDWVLSHVRAGQEVFESEVEQSGFRKVGQVDGILKENYLLIFEKK
jgi:ubiquinone/menaquinone biosynthesis C-methylase UbiE